MQPNESDPFTPKVAEAREGDDPTSFQLRTESFRDLHEGKVPSSALVVSLIALAAAAGVNLLWPHALHDYVALVWLFALIPAFLLTYYRGWRGAAFALVVSMLLLVAIELGGSLFVEREVQWWAVSVVVAVLIAVSLGAGFTAERLHRRAEEALKMAYADPLTGLPNRRILQTFLANQFAAAQRGRPLSVALFDIDGFKSYNDEYGHGAGDDAIRAVASILDENTRTMNLSGRYGGDEFLALLPDEEAEGAFRFANRIRRSIASIQVSTGRPLTVSVGVATYHPAITDPQALLEAADRALYAAKRVGRNGAVVNAEHGIPEHLADWKEAMVVDSAGEVLSVQRVPSDGTRPGEAADAPAQSPGA